jgi:hypothetical protein
VHLVPIDRIRVGEKLVDCGRQRRSACDVGDIRLQHGEFIAAKTRHEIDPPHRLGESFHNLAQQLVATRMTERVVDIFEVIEVEIQQSERVCATLEFFKCRGKSIEKRPAIGKPRERVLFRQIGDSPVCPHQTESVAAQRHLSVPVLPPRNQDPCGKRQHDANGRSSENR